MSAIGLCPHGGVVPLPIVFGMNFILIFSFFIIP